MIGLSSVRMIEHKGDDAQYSKAQAFVGDTVRLFLNTDNGIIGGTITAIGSSTLQIDGKRIQFSKIRAFNVYARGDIFRTIMSAH